MAITEARFNKLESRVNEIADRLAKIEVERPPQKANDWKAWIPIGAPVAALLAVMVTLAIYFDGKLSTIQRDLNDSKVRVGKIESAVKVLGDNQKNDIKQMIHDLLASANSANPEIAKRTVETVASLTDTLKKEREPADAEFFAQTFDTIRVLEKSNPEAAFKVKLALAEYRSALEKPPALPQSDTYKINSPEDLKNLTQQMMRKGLTLVLTDKISVGVWLQGNDNISGLNFEVEKSHTIPIYVNRDVRGSTISSGFIRGGTQTLDRVEWTNYVFIGTHIEYNGGPLKLTNVQFVNCTFDVAPTERGAQLTEYAALADKLLTIS